MTNNTYDNTYIHTNVRQYIVAEVDYRGSAAPKKREKRQSGRSFMTAWVPLQICKKMFCAHIGNYIYSLSVRLFVFSTVCLSVIQTKDHIIIFLLLLMRGGGPPCFLKPYFCNTFLCFDTNHKLGNYNLGRLAMFSPLQTFLLCMEGQLVQIFFRSGAPL